MKKKRWAKHVARCLLAILIFQGCLFPAGAEAGDLSNLEERIGALGVIVADTTADLVLLTKIKTALEDTYTVEQEIDTRDDDYYERDHALLANRVWKDWTPEARALYSQLSAKGALSFAASLDYEMFEAQNPGYRDAEGEYIDFAQAYKDRIDKWEDYLYGVFEANNTQAEDIRQSQATIQNLKTASQSAYGYRQVLQAGNQITDFVNQEFSKLRVDLQRQLEAETRYALNEQQERTDAQSAFEGAVKKWKDQSPGKGY